MRTNSFSIGFLSILFVWASAPATTQPNDLESLRQALSFHCSFDAGADADFARGNRRVRTMTRQQPFETRRGLWAEHVTIETGGGRHGGALRFHRPNQQILLFGDAVSLGYDPDDWNGTVSFWMSLDPDRDLTPGLFCDPMHITDATEWDDASMWLTFARTPPWRFSFGATADLEAWNPEGRKWSEMEPAERPRVVVDGQPFARDAWTHVAFTFQGFNRGAGEGVARLYVDGELQGEIAGHPQTHTWDPAKAAIQMGLNYVGRVDDLAVFDRAFSAAEVRTLYTLPAGVSGLHAGPPAAAPVAGSSPIIDHPAVRAWVEAWNTGTGDGLESFLTEDVAFTEPTVSSDDRAGYRRLMRFGLAFLREVEFKAEDLILDGDRGALTWTATATHNGSGRQVRIHGVSTFVFRDGKIAREWRVYDRADFLRQIGVLPSDGDGN